MNMPMNEDQQAAHNMNMRINEVYMRLNPLIVAFVESKLQEMGCQPDDMAAYNGAAMSYLILGTQAALFLGSDKPSFMARMETFYEAAVVQQRSAEQAFQAKLAHDAAVASQQQAAAAQSQATSSISPPVQVTPHSNGAPPAASKPKKPRAPRPPKAPKATDPSTEK